MESISMGGWNAQENAYFSNPPEQSAVSLRFFLKLWGWKLVFEEAPCRQNGCGGDINHV